MTPEQQKVLARVRKMLALANNAAATEGERENALRMAHNALAAHNLSLSQAEASGAAPEESRIQGEMVGKDFPWMRTTAAAVARLFFCEYLYVLVRGGKVVHYFVGRESNTVTAREMTAYIISSIDREGRRWASESYTGSNGWRSFCKGAAARVYARCDAIRKEAERAPVTPSTSTALVLSSVYAQETSANKALILAKYGEGGVKEKASQQRNTDYDSARAGREYGDKVSLNKQVGGHSASDPSRRLK